MSLVDEVRTLSGATTDEADNDRIIAALDRTSVAFANARVIWHLLPNGLYSRAGYIPIGKYQVEATDAVNSVAPPVLHDIDGVPVADVTMGSSGNVVLTDEDAIVAPFLYATGSLYDVHGAAADVVAGMVAVASRDYDFARGDQRFERSQVVGQLKALLKDLRRQRIAKRRGEVVMLDQAPGRYPR